MRSGTASARDERKKSPVIKDNDGESGAELDNDLEAGGLRAHKTEKISRDDQVTGRGDRNKFRDPFDNPEDYRYGPDVQSLRTLQCRSEQVKERA